MTELPDNVFRANVGGIVVNSENLILALERTAIPGAWQLPQGGLEEGEQPEVAVVREVCEETGLAPTDFQIIDEYPEWIAYELPTDKRNSKVGRGQVQKWFLLKLTANDGGINLNKGPEPEFRNWRWTTFSWLVDRVVSFRRSTYRKLAIQFRLK